MTLENVNPQLLAKSQEADQELVNEVQEMSSTLQTELKQLADERKVTAQAFAIRSQLNAQKAQEREEELAQLRQALDQTPSVPATSPATAAETAPEAEPTAQPAASVPQTEAPLRPVSSVPRVTHSRPARTRQQVTSVVRNSNRTRWIKILVALAVGIIVYVLASWFWDGVIIDHALGKSDNDWANNPFMQFLFALVVAAIAAIALWPTNQDDSTTTVSTTVEQTDQPESHP